MRRLKAETPAASTDAGKCGPYAARFVESLMLILAFNDTCATEHWHMSLW